MRFQVLFSGLVFGLMLISVTASAFEHEYTCNEYGVPPEPGACEAGEVPMARYWGRNCLFYHIHEDVPDAYLVSIRYAFLAWSQVECSYIHFMNDNDMRTNEDRVGYNSCTPENNVNLVIFRTIGWRHGSDSYAHTTATFNEETGEVVDVDIEINFQFYDFTPEEVEKVIMHEIGHGLGLAHTSDEGSIMYGSTPPDEIVYMEIGDDDVAGVCTIYPGTTGDRICGSMDGRRGWFEKPVDGPGTTCPQVIEQPGCQQFPANPSGETVAMVLLAIGLVGLRRLRG